MYFGTQSGDVYAFNKNASAPISYSDNGMAIPAHWQTAALQGTHFYKNKYFKRCAIRLEQFSRTGVNLSALKEGTWVTLFTDNSRTIGYFDFNVLDFRSVNFNPCAGSRTLNTRIKIRKTDKMQLRLSNDDNETPFGIEALAVEYSEYGNYKGLSDE